MTNFKEIILVLEGKELSLQALVKFHELNHGGGSAQHYFMSHKNCYVENPFNFGDYTRHLMLNYFFIFILTLLCHL
jgi:hypothetical protein